MGRESDPDDGRSDLRARVEQLEATVEAQQQTIQQLLPSRRRVLQAGGLVAGGGVLGALTADRASADVTGQVGTQQDRVDVFGGTVDANSVNTDEATTGNLTVQEDGNSPLIVSGSSSGTITLASQYDVVKCYIVDNSGAQKLGLQVNGDTGANYDAVTINGTERTGQSEIGPLGFTNLATGLQMVMAGSWSGGFNVSNRPVDDQSERVVGGRNKNVNSPLDSITLTASSVFSATMHVFGLNFS